MARIQQARTNSDDGARHPEIDSVVTKGLCYASHSSYNQIYLLAGVNNLTVLKDKQEVDPRYHTWSKLVRSFMIEYYTARARLLKLSDCVIICDLIALHIGTYNRSGTPFYYHQEINEYIKEMNFDSWVYSPRFARQAYPAQVCRHHLRWAALHARNNGQGRVNLS